MSFAFLNIEQSIDLNAGAEFIDAFRVAVTRLRVKTNRYRPRPLDFDPKFGGYGPNVFSSRAPFGNCYAYALNIQMSRVPQPGELNSILGWDVPYEDRTIEGLDKRLRRDGLKRIFLHEADPEKSQIIAVFTVPAQRIKKDYHCYRMNKDGTWSHKHGERLPSNQDMSGDVITDIMRADRGDFTEFVGIYEVPNQGIEYRI